MVGVLEVAGAVGLLIPLVSSLAALRLAAVMVGAAMTNQFLLVDMLRRDDHASTNGEKQ